MKLIPSEEGAVIVLDEVETKALTDARHVHSDVMRLARGVVTQKPGAIVKSVDANNIVTTLSAPLAELLKESP